MPNAEYRIENDGGFIGFDSRTNPALLKPQLLQYAQNIRIERGEAQTRKGFARVDNALLENKPIYGSCLYVTYEGVEKIILVSDDEMIVYNPNDETFAPYSYPDYAAQVNNEKYTVGPSDRVSAVHAGDKVYIFRGIAGPYREATLSNTANIVTAVVSGDPHGFVVGDEIIVSDIDSTAPIPTHFTTNAFVTEVVNASTFRYKVVSHSGEHSNKLALVQKAKTPLVWNGTTVQPMPQGSTSGPTANMPPSDTAVYFGNRMILRMDRNTIAVSDYLSFDEFDLTYGQFTINQGANDKIVSITPWADDEFLVFQRNSIYIGRAVNASYAVGAGLEDTSYLKTVTTSFGAVARDSVINTGRFVFFLSDHGIFMLEPQLDLRLINTIEPISSAIDNIINSLRRDLLDQACGVYFNNRMFMAVPIDQPAPAAATTGNNAVLVFNLINKAWESVDVINSNQTIKNWIVCLRGEEKRLFVVTSNGLYLTDENNKGDETAEYGVPYLPETLPFNLSSSENSYNKLDSYIVSRRMTFGTAREKRFSAAQVDMFYDEKGAYQTEIKILNPDQLAVIDTHSSQSGQDYTRRHAIARKGYAAEVILRTVDGRPVFRNIAVEATVPNRSNRNAE